MMSAAVAFKREDAEKRASSADLAEQTAQRVTRTLQDKIELIQEVTRRTKILAINASIESARAGQAGRSFAIVAEEVRAISQEIDSLAQSLRSELVSQVGDMRTRAKEMAEAAAHKRLIDLSLNAVELIDRNLYERSCDVRWWATDAAIVAGAASASAEDCAFACERMGVILNAYTVYLDLWLCDRAGNVIANGRPDRYRTDGVNVAHERWFKQAMQTSTGDDYVCADIAQNKHLQNAAVATYAAAVRENGDPRGRIIGVLGVHFDWTPQAQTIVTGLRLTPEEWANTRAMLLDHDGRVIAASDNRGLLSETFPLEHQGRSQGAYVTPSGDTVGFSLTPGYETYKGMGWYGCVVTHG